MSKTNITSGQMPKKEADTQADSAAASSLFVGSVEKAFSVLAAFSGHRRPLSLSEIDEITGLGKSAAQRFCHTLISLGYLEREEASRRIRPAIGLLELSHPYLASEPISRAAAPYLLNARNQCGQAMNLGLPKNNEIIYVSRLRSVQFSLLNPIPGGRAPLFCTSSGRAYLSGLDPSEAEIIVRRSELSPLTRHTITDTDPVLEQIELCRTRGYALANQECVAGELSVGAPIFNENKRVVAAINICAFLPNWTIEQLEERLAPLVMQTANEISYELAN